jgi:hypothetical protein
MRTEHPRSKGVSRTGSVAWGTTLRVILVSVAAVLLTFCFVSILMLSSCTFGQ